MSAPNSEPVPPKAATPPRRSRIDAVDMLRGLVMVIMLLDHTRDFVHHDSFFMDPTDITRTYPALFFTRWITHYCAPIFVFLAGAGTYFQVARGKSKADLSRFLVTRGFWLILLEFTAVRLAASWELHYSFLGMMQVIWVIGWGMIVLAALIHLPTRIVAAFGLVMMATHNLLDGIKVTQWQGPGSPVPSVGDRLWDVFHQQAAFPIAGWPSPVILILYPLIPWLGVMAAGYAFGSVYDRPPDERRRWLFKWGTTVTVGFIVIRAINFYGDPGHWAVQKSFAMTVVSFLDVQKYPPSLLYLMMTLGPALLFLGMWERYNDPDPAASAKKGLKGALITFGRVPLFFYLLQWPTAHGAGFLLTYFAGKDTLQYFQPFVGGAPTPANAGFSLWVVYAAWITGVLLLYPLCKWYAGVKARRRDWWLSYL